MLGHILMLMDFEGAYLVLDGHMRGTLMANKRGWESHPHALFLERADGTFECIHGEGDVDVFMARANMEGWLMMTMLGWDCTPRHVREAGTLPAHWCVT